MVASAVSTKAMREAALYLTGFTRDQVYGVGLDLLPEALVDRLRARAAHVRELMTEAVRREPAAPRRRVRRGHRPAAAPSTRSP